MKDDRSQRSLEIMQIIRDALMCEWDSIGVAGIPQAADEYDSYIGSVYRILSGSRSEDELAKFLYYTAKDNMGAWWASE